MTTQTTPTLADVQGAIAQMDRAEVISAHAQQAEHFSEAQKDREFYAYKAAQSIAGAHAIAYCRSAGWLPIESAPRDKLIIAYTADPEHWKPAETARFDGHNWHDMTYGWDGVLYPTHWWPMPDSYPVDEPPRQPTADALTHPPQGVRDL